MGGFVLFVILERGWSGYRCQWGEGSVRGNDGDGGHAAQWTCQQIPPSRENWHTRSHISTTGHRFDSLLPSQIITNILLLYNATKLCLETLFSAYLTVDGLFRWKVQKLVKETSF